MISESTPVTIGLLILALPALFFLVSICRDVKQIKRGMGNVWTVSHQKVWSDRLRHRNKGLNLPCVDDVVEDLGGKRATGDT